MTAKIVRVKGNMGGLKKRDIPLLLAFAKNVYASMKAASASFPNPVPTLADFLVLINALQAIQDEMKGPTKPTATAREAKRIPVVTALEKLLAYAQGLADLLTPHDGAALLVLAGYKVATTPTHHKEPVTARQPTPGGPITLEAYAAVLTATMAAHAVTYHWRYMLPAPTPAPAGPVPAPVYVTWTSPTSKTTVPITPPIPPLTTLVFEASVADSDTQTAWVLSQPFLVR